eukprot:GEZU01001277.1.p1 GENE.GEZU01001277.1~~GEZU01001277.1.p1  ORF type:complete len:111 (-),score=1.10 GEZU01001277.1:132-464(-)
MNLRGDREASRTANGKLVCIILVLLIIRRDEAVQTGTKQVLGVPGSAAHFNVIGLFLVLAPESFAIEELAHAIKCLLRWSGPRIDLLCGGVLAVAWALWIACLFQLQSVI